jgi:hypothetical protein
MPARDFTAADNRILAAVAAGCQLTKWFYGSRNRHGGKYVVMILLHPDGRRRLTIERNDAIYRLWVADAIVSHRSIDDWDGLDDCSYNHHDLYELTDVGRERAATVKRVDLEKLFAPGPKVTTPERNHLVVYRNAKLREQARIRDALHALGYIKSDPDEIHF